MELTEVKKIEMTGIQTITKKKSKTPSITMVNLKSGLELSRKIRSVVKINMPKKHGYYTYKIYSRHNGVLNSSTMEGRSTGQ